MQTLTLGDCRFDLLTAGDEFLGLGACWIGDTQVRSGRLPLQVYSQTFDGRELYRSELVGVDTSETAVRIRLRALFRPLPVKIMRDHSFDPIDELGDWGDDQATGEAELDLVLEPATDRFNGVAAAGFRYHWEYRSADVAIYHLRERASWELDGDITGASAISQSSCSAPTAHFAADTAWSTEGVLWFLVEKGAENPVMTHNLPRWASHQAFDYQYKNGRTLLGVFERVDLIRSVVCRDAGKPELKVFDKHIFDQTTRHTSTAKAILLVSDPPVGEVGQQNLWTWVLDEVHGRARAEYGLQEEPLRVRVNQNYWKDFTIDRYYKDLLPAAAAIGAESIFVDNLNKSDMTAGSPFGNMCCGHEYEVAPELGGPAALKAFVARCAEHGIQPFAWTNNDQSYCSPVNRSERDERGWFVRMEDARLKYGGAYTNVFNILDLSVPEARDYHRDSLIAIKEETGLDGYLYDSFYNLGFMPVSYGGMRPHTHWRGCLQFMKDCQDAGVHFMIESGGPFGEVQHGHPTSYNLDVLFACYKVMMGSGYTTVPTGQEVRQARPWPEPDHYRILAYMVKSSYPLFYGGERVDSLLSDEHRRHIRDFIACRRQLHRRYLLADDAAVIWHDEAGAVATIFSFQDQTVALPGTVHCVSTGETLPQAASYTLSARHTYTVSDAATLPTSL